MAATNGAAKETLVLFPSTGLGHLIPMVELGKRFLRHGLSIVVLVLDPLGNPAATAAFLAHVSATVPAISFHRLPPISLPLISSPNGEASIFAKLRLSNPNLIPLLTSLTSSSDVRALILDFFCTDALDVAQQFHLPAYIYFVSSGCGLAAFLHLPVIHRRTTASYKDLGDEPIELPGIPPIPASDILRAMQDRDDEAYNGFIFIFDRMRKADGIIVNTFRALEPRAIRAVEDGVCVPGHPVPPLYCVGPVVREEKEAEEEHDCLAWLDEQPIDSVLFLCFGSKGRFSVEQLREIAVGLERSGQRFLWVVRSPEPWAEPDLESLLPDGFVERTKGRGLVVKRWAPQVAVLGHGAVGGFVSHCGWNSALEAVCAGVAMICWPLYAEQRMNKVFLVEELKLAVEMKRYGEGLVGAAEVEERVTWLMCSEGGRELRERGAAAKAGAAAGLAEQGSSSVALAELVNKWKRGPQTREG